MSKNPQYFQRIHALDITTGKEEFSGPTTIQAKFPGHGDNSHNGNVIFDPETVRRAGRTVIAQPCDLYRPGLPCDQRPYTGWLMGYDEHAGANQCVECDAQCNQGAIWQAGSGVASDGKNLFFLDGNGTFDTKLTKKGFPAEGTSRKRFS